jgi:excisionase family DNA binding protein
MPGHFTTDVKPKRKPGRPPKPLPDTPALPDPTALTIRPEEAARAVGVSLTLMKRWLKDGRAPSTTVGRVRLVSVAGLRALVGADR